MNLLLSDYKVNVMFIILFIASLKDMHDRIIPDRMPFLIMLISMMPVGLPHPTGMIACLPLLIAGVTVGGVGGGDIKIIAAVGTVCGFEKTFIGLMAALVAMIMFYVISYVLRKVRELVSANVKTVKMQQCEEWNHKSYPMVPFIFLGMLLAVNLS